MSRLLELELEPKDNGDSGYKKINLFSFEISVKIFFTTSQIVITILSFYNKLLTFEIITESWVFLTAAKPFTLSLYRKFTKLKGMPPQTIATDT